MRNGLKKIFYLVTAIMPQFRIHSTRNRTDRVLIRMVRNTNHVATHVTIVPTPIVSVSVPDTAPAKSKKKINMRHIQEIIKLLQKSTDKNVNKILSSKLKTLLSQQDDEEVDVDEVEEDSDVEIEEVEDEEVAEDDEDVLIIDL